MTLSIQLHSIRSLNESSEASASDELDVFVTVATLQPPIAGLPIPAVPNFRMFQYGVFTDMDDDAESPVVVTALAGPDDVFGSATAKYSTRDVRTLDSAGSLPIVTFSAGGRAGAPHPARRRTGDAP